MASAEETKKWKAIPKVELHAHFFGSISRATLQQQQLKRMKLQQKKEGLFNNSKEIPLHSHDLSPCLQTSPHPAAAAGENVHQAAAAAPGPPSATRAAAAAATLSGMQPAAAADLPAAEAAELRGGVEGRAVGAAAAVGLREEDPLRGNGKCAGSERNIYATTSREKCAVEGLDGAFDYFAAAYQLIRTEEDIRYAMKEVLREFHEDNVVYLELRTTLKHIEEEDIDAQRYIDILVEELENAAKLYSSLTVKLIVSINRALLQNDRCTQEEEVEKALQAAARYPQWIVGIDVAGDPRKGNLSFVLKKLQQEINDEKGRFFKQLKWTVHTAEIAGVEEETERILSARPHRIGHGCFLTDEQRLRLIEQGVVTEICPSSNMCTLDLPHLRDHHLNFFYNKQRACSLSSMCICTDDPGLFETSLSKELGLVAEAYALSVSDVLQLQHTALAAAFCTEEEKQELRERHFSQCSGCVELH